MARVGIIGGGAMGQWLKKEFSASHQVLIYDVDRRKSDLYSLEELAQWAEVLIVAAPFWATAGVLSQLAPLSSGRLVMDIATFKEGVVESYGVYPRDAKVATVHPMFGPGAETIRGQKVLVMEIPGRDGAEDAAHFWRQLGAEVAFANLQKHDYYVSYTIALSYAVGLALARIYRELGEEALLYGGTSFKWLATYANSLLKDPNAVRYAEKAPLDRFVEALKRKDVPTPTADPDKAYQDFYKALSCIDA